MITCHNDKDFLKFISKKKILIYGAGYVASIFLEALKKHGLAENIQGFVVSSEKRMQSFIEGYPVKLVSQLAVDEEIIVCIAVHEVLKKEIESTLSQKEILNYIWVYPFLYHLCLGQPVEEGKWMDTKEIILHNCNQYGIAVRWAAIDAYYSNCPYGADLYKKAMAMHCGQETAEERYTRFTDLMRSWDVVGYQKEHQIALTVKNEILDGEHRAALALYHRQDRLQCRIYGGQNLHREAVLMEKETFLKNGFGQEEIEKLDEINSHIRSIVSVR